MVGKQPVWVLDASVEPYSTLREELAQQDVALATFTTVDAILTAARSPQARLPRLLVIDAAFLDALLTSQPTSAPRAALLRNAPFLIVAAGDRPELIKNAFDLGALDVLPKPVNPGELQVKIARALAQTAGGAGGSAGEGRLAFNVAFLTVTAADAPPATLTPREFQILTILYRAQSHCASRSELFAQVWSEVSVCNKVLDVHVSKLRKKLLPLGVGIAFVRPAAYQLAFGAAAAAASLPSATLDGEPEREKKAG